MQGLEVDGMESSYIQVLTTTDKKEDAKNCPVPGRKKARGLCPDSWPIISLYRWKGNFERANEWQCWIKSKYVLYKEIEKTIKSVHPYEVPEIIAHANCGRKP